jgi:radical SAM superfamily enzyme YgiQ (UPF0313 family)
VRVALVNTNRYVEPPTIPVGLEYLLVPLERAGHDTRVLDLAFSEDPAAELARFIDAEKPDVLGFSVRNVDTGLYTGNLSFLGEVAGLVEAARACTGAPVFVGGAATACSGDALRVRLGADYLVRGPGEVAFPRALEAIASGTPLPPVIDGWKAGIIPDVVHRRGAALDYAPYLAGGNPAGLEFRKGCEWGCSYCIERCRPMLTRDTAAVVAEARALADLGVSMFFMCDCEVNHDIEDTARLLEALAREELPLKWSGYFKPVPFDERLARTAAASGCTSWTLAVASGDLSDGAGPYHEEDVTRFIGICAEQGIKVAVDLIVGLPGEAQASVERALDFLEGSAASTVGVASQIRLYETIPVAALAFETVEGKLLGAAEGNPSMLEPVFFSAVDASWLEARLRSSSIFTIAGAERKVNYQVLE